MVLTSYRGSQLVCVDCRGKPIRRRPRQSPGAALIIKLRKAGTASPTQLARATGRRPKAVWQSLELLIARHLVVRVARGEYRAA